MQKNIEELLQEYSDVESKIQKVLLEQPTIQAEREMLKREVAKKIAELRELGVTFADKEDLEKTFKENIEILENSMESLKRKLSEYEDLKNEISNKYENDEGGIY